MATAKQQYDELCDAELEPDPLERLRFFCSLAMTGQDWLDVEPFFDDVQAAIVPNVKVRGAEPRFSAERPS